MRRSPIFAYVHPQFQPSSDVHCMLPTQNDPAYFQSRPYPHLCTSSSSSTAPAPRSVINIPVRDFNPSLTASDKRRPSHPPKPLGLHLNQAAIRIQSCFRGFAVRRHRPIINLRSIFGVRNELEQVKSEIESPGFASKIRRNEKERLRFSEGVMALILRLDAIEGSLAEVRSQRKEVTKMAIGLQDAIDAIMMQPDNALASSANEGPLDDKTKAKDEELAHVVGTGLEEILQRTQAEQPSVFNKSHMSNDNGEILLNSDHELVGPPSAAQNDILEAAVALMATRTGDTSLDDQEAGEDLSAILQDNLLIERRNQTDEDRDVPEHDMEAEETSCADFGDELLIERRVEVDQEGNPADASIENVPSTVQIMDVVANGIDLKSTRTEQNANCLGGYADNESSSKCTGNDSLLKNIQYNFLPEVQSPPFIGQPPESLSTTKIGDLVSMEVLSDPSSDVPFLADKVKASSEVDGVPLMPNCLTMEGEPTEQFTEGKPESCVTVEIESSPSDKVLLQQLSNDCKQLQSLLNKLLVQNRAQSKVICALGDRLDSLEQQQLNNNQNRQRKRKKGSNKIKKNTKACHFERTIH